MPQRAAVRRDAVPDGGRAHAGLRDHEPRQPRARLALHGRRLPGHRGLNRTGSFLAAVAFALAATLAIGMLVEVIALRTLYERDHLDQVLATFGLILFFNEAVAIVWG